MSTHDDGGPAKRDFGGPAFPVPALWANHGMSRWAYYAGAALTGLLYDVVEPDTEVVAEMAFDMADAMVAEMRKREGDG